MSQDHSDELLSDSVEHDDHIDERWLVSYADMMTLLFGLFVLLYSIASMDKKTAEKVVQSTQEKFGDASKEETPPVTVDPQTEIRILKDEKKALEEQIKLQAAQQLELEDLKKKMSEKSEEHEKLQLVHSQLEVELKNTSNQQKSSQDLSKRIAELEKIKNNIESEKDVLNRKVKVLESENDAIVKLNQKNNREVSSVEKYEEKIKNLEKKLDQSTSLKAEIASQQKAAEDKIRELASQNKTLQKELQAHGESNNKAFLAVFINWSTRDHDIDLVIKDPNGRKFDFKNRKHGGHPGYFALDTRRGPGAELWQSDRIIPGTYTATYSFYNQYGNTEPAKVSGTIYSAKGSFDIQPVQMDLTSKKEYKIRFDVKEDGQVQVLNSGH